MKKLKLLLFISIFVLISSCSKDDSISSSNIRSNYQVGLRIDCETLEPTTLYCVTQAEYDRTYPLSGGDCEIITLVDIFGETHLGAPNTWKYYIDGYDCN